MSDHLQFESKIVLIIGSSAEMGAVHTREFARQGARLDALGSECNEVSHNGLAPLLMVSDVTNDEDIENLVESIQLKVSVTLIFWSTMQVLGLMPL